MLKVESWQMRLCPTFSDCAESALLVDFGLHHDRQVSLSIFQVSTRLQASKLPGLKESIPALSSLTVLYDPLELSRERIVHEIQQLCEVSGAAPDCARTWEIPVVYGGEAGPDLEEVALRAGLSEEEAVALHAGRDYSVYMLGFSSGLCLSRRSARRTGYAATGHAARPRASGIGRNSFRHDRDLPA